MKLEKEQVLEGYFWLPGEDERLSGRLRISPVSACRLELLGRFGSLFNPKEAADLSTIHGLIEGGAVTLYKCHYQDGSKIGFGTVSLSKVYVETVFRGANLPPERELRLTELSAAVTGLDEWLQMTGLSSNFELGEGRKVRGAFIHYRPPPKIEWKLPGLTVGIDFAWTANFGDAGTEAKITHQARLVVTPDEEMPFQALSHQLGRVVNFLAFATDQVVSIDELFAHTRAAMRDTTEGDKAVSLPVFYESSAPPRTPKVDRDTWLFGFADVAESLQEMLTRWMNHYEELAPAFNLYFAVRSGRHTYLESAYLSIAQSVETLHARTSDEALIAPDDFKDRLDRVLASCPEDLREWVGEELEHADKPSLRSRLRRMIKPFAKAFGANAKEREDFVTLVADTRNYLTHYQRYLEARAAHREDLFHLTEKLEALFQLHLLRMVGTSDARIDQLVATNRRLRYRLGLDD